MSNLSIQAQSFVSPTHQSYYLNPYALQEVVQAMDQNHDRLIGQDELRLSPHLRSQIDRNRDGRIQIRELTEALQNNQVSLRGFSRTVSYQVAQAILPEWVHSVGLGRLGETLDRNADGYVTRQELSIALNRGEVMINGSYLSAVNGPGGPGGPTGPGFPGQAFERVKSNIESIQSNTMKNDRWGNPDPSTGIFTPVEANQKINALLSRDLVPSHAVSLQDKFALLTQLKMKKDRWGNDDISTGSLTAAKATELALQAAHQSHVNTFEPGFANAHLQALSSQKMALDRWGNEDPSTGLLKATQANDLIKSFLQNTVLKSNALSNHEKLDLIKSLAMKNDRWGNPDPRSGALTLQEVNRLSKQVFEFNHLESGLFFQKAA